MIREPQETHRDYLNSKAGWRGNERRPRSGDRFSEAEGLPLIPLSPRRVGILESDFDAFLASAAGRGRPALDAAEAANLKGCEKKPTGATGPAGFNFRVNPASQRRIHHAPVSYIICRPARRTRLPFSNSYVTLPGAPEPWFHIPPPRPPEPAPQSLTADCAVCAPPAQPG